MALKYCLLSGLETPGVCVYHSLVPRPHPVHISFRSVLGLVLGLGPRLMSLRHYCQVYAEQHLITIYRHFVSFLCHLALFYIPILPVSVSRSYFLIRLQGTHKNLVSGDYPPKDIDF